MTGAAFLLLVDARLPTGAHAHSGGMEEAVSAGRVRAVSDLAGWLEGRLMTVGVVDAAFAVAGHRLAGRARTRRLPPGGWAELAGEWAARVVPQELRTAGRAQGRGLLRAARTCWPDPILDALAGEVPAGIPWPVALGAVGLVAGATAEEVAAGAAGVSVSGPAWATTRLLGADPFAVASALAGLSAQVDAVAREAACGQEAAVDLPALSAPLLDLGAARHSAWEVRLFAS